MTRLQKLTLALSALATVGAGVPALAQDSMFEATSRVVRYDDLDLNNERGRERLDRRLRHAANSACGFWQARTLAEKQVADQCRDAALAKAKAEADAAKAKSAKAR
jgi:UrcA family protein